MKFIQRKVASGHCLAHIGSEQNFMVWGFKEPPYNSDLQNEKHLHKHPRASMVSTNGFQHRNLPVGEDVFTFCLVGLQAKISTICILNLMLMSSMCIKKYL